MSRVALLCKPVPPARWSESEIERPADLGDHRWCDDPGRCGRPAMETRDMDVQLAATPMGNGFQATITFFDGLSMSSAEAFPSKAEAILAAAEMLLRMPDRLQRAECEEPARPSD